MQRRRFLGMCAAAGVAAVTGTGCGRARPLKFGIHPWIGYEPLYLAEEFGWLPAPLQLVRGRSAGDSMAGLASGALDGAALTLDEAIRVHTRGTELYVVAVTDVSAGADVLVARPEIGSVEQLVGRRVAVEMNGVSGVLFLSLLERSGIPRDRLTVVDLPVDRHLEAWQQGRVAASACYEPVASLLEDAGGVRLFDSRQIPETIFDVLVVTRRRAEQDPALVTDLVLAYFRGQQHLVRNRHDAVYRAAARQNIRPEDVQAALACVMLPDLSSNHRYLAPNGRIETVARHLSRMLTREGLLPAPLGEDRLCNPAFLPRRLS